MKYLIFTFISCCSFFVQELFSQSLAVNTDGSVADATAMVDIKSTTKGLLIPRLTTAQRTGIGTPATSLMVYDTDLNQYYYYNGTAWTVFATTANYWTLSGSNLYNNAGTQVGIGTATSGETVADKLGVGGNIRLIGSDTIYIAQSTTGSAKSLTIRSGYAYVPIGGSGGDLNLFATNNMPAGGSGYSNLGPSGNVNITAGSGYNSSGGNITIRAGATSCWALPGGNHSDVTISGGQNLALSDASSIVYEGGYTIGTSCATTPGSTGGNLLLKPGTASGTGINGSIQLAGVVALGTSMGLTGGTAGLPVSLINYKSYIGLSPADATNNNYQLPSPLTYPGRMYIIRNNSASFTANILTAAALLFPGNSNIGGASYTLNPTSSPKTVIVISDGTNWTVMKQD
jgi:hypothetical protein